MNTTATKRKRKLTIVEKLIKEAKERLRDDVAPKLVKIVPVKVAKI